jgi:DNA-directed RNA polymerase specialized sigma24 family protein
LRQGDPLQERLAAWYADRAQTVAIGCGTIGRTAALAARDAITDQIERGVLGPAEVAEFEAYCEQVLRIHLALLELAQICRRGSESSWPSAHPAANADAWQSTYERLAIRISDGRVDVDRPLLPLARVTAYRLMLSERLQQARLLKLTDLQLHRFNLGEEAPPEEVAESARRAAMLRESFARLRRSGQLSELDQKILQRRYASEWNSPEVAAAVGATAANVRQLCKRRCALLRADLGGLELEETPS